MKKILAIFIISCVAVSCSFKDKYDVAKYYDAKEQDEMLTRIVTFIFEAPPYTKLEDRFSPKHYNFYNFAARKFTIEKYYIAENGVHYFYVLRPGPGTSVKRAVGGYYEMDRDNRIYGFREAFVTQLLPEKDVKGKASFLFDEMVKGDIEQYLKMGSYVQWPNPASFYDTVKYQWALRPEAAR